eukprot:CAMPEP_0178963460 /NCGR_PEP_ID=MMETSP0789-20121207/15041_1 /TAXON_ID=3005 /ORGANISM="Rhizosolenia setigera, Strain CCMP 1694" /LENGTH=129 /DNA_ID=CAMNT_0020647941 /DNA_START=112 /DNA_END=501 /DNA_ORIENTATION=+
MIFKSNVSLVILCTAFTYSSSFNSPLSMHKVTHTQYSSYSSSSLFSTESEGNSDGEGEGAAGGREISPEMADTLMSSPEIMALLQDPKMQECMRLLNTEGPESIEKAMSEDPELRELAAKLNELFGGTM